MWEPTTTLANQRGPQQRQRPLGLASLVTADLQRASQSVGAGRSCSYLEAARVADLERTQQQRGLLPARPSADSGSGCLDPLGNLLPALTAPWPSRSHLAADTRKTAVASTQASPLWPEPRYIRRALPYSWGPHNISLVTTHTAWLFICILFF
jgi:hypothetical protein